jgi:predicted metal-dependent hydrolase
VDAALEEGVRLFNGGSFEESHEEFEEGWLANEGADSDFFKGLIQAAICLHKLEQGQLDGTKKLHAGMRRYLATFLPQHRGVDLLALLRDMRAFVDESLSDPSAIAWEQAPRMSPPV